MVQYLVNFNKILTIKTLPRDFATFRVTAFIGGGPGGKGGGGECISSRLVIIKMKILNQIL